MKYRPPGFILQNGQITIRLQGEKSTLPTGCHTIHPVGGSPRLRPIAIRPKTPVSQTESVGLTDQQFIKAESKSTPPGYSLIHQYKLNQTPIQVSWTVRLPAGRRFAIFDVRITNHGKTKIRLDQDRGDTHDGIQLATRFGFDSSSTEAPIQFTHRWSDVRQLEAQSQWKTYPNTRWMSVFDESGGATFTYLRGASAPKMVVVNQGALDYLVNERLLYADTSIGYRFGVFLHSWDSEPSKKVCWSAAKRMRSWEENQLRTE